MSAKQQSFQRIKTPKQNQHQWRKDGRMQSQLQNLVNKYSNQLQNTPQGRAMLGKYLVNAKFDPRAANQNLLNDIKRYMTPNNKPANDPNKSGAALDQTLSNGMSPLQQQQFAELAGVLDAMNLQDSAENQLENNEHQANEHGTDNTVEERTKEEEAEKDLQKNEEEKTENSESESKNDLQNDSNRPTPELTLKAFDESKKPEELEELTKKGTETSLFKEVFKKGVEAFAGEKGAEKSSSSLPTPSPSMGGGGGGGAGG